MTFVATGATARASWTAAAMAAMPGVASLTTLGVASAASPPGVPARG